MNAESWIVASMDYSDHGHSAEQYRPFKVPELFGGGILPGHLWEGCCHIDLSSQTLPVTFTCFPLCEKNWMVLCGEGRYTR